MAFNNKNSEKNLYKYLNSLFFKIVNDVYLIIIFLKSKIQHKMM